MTKPPLVALPSLAEVEQDNVKFDWVFVSYDGGGSLASVPLCILYFLDLLLLCDEHKVTAQPFSTKTVGLNQFGSKV